MFRPAGWGSILGALLLLALPLSGCAAPAAQQSQGSRTWPDGWTAEAPAETYHRDNLYDLVNGQADAYYAYGFEDVTVHEVCQAEGQCLTAQVWQVDSPASAYGLYSSSVAGNPIDVANGGDEDPGRRLLFWQDRYVVELFARETMPSERLRDFGAFLSTTLPAGGAPPALLDRLPRAGLETGPSLYFREELSLQNELWLGGENILGLGPDSKGVLASYEVKEQPVQLLLVQYPDASTAAAALGELRAESPEGLLLAEANGALLGATFGELDAEKTRDLLAEALR